MPFFKPKPKTQAYNFSIESPPCSVKWIPAPELDLSEDGPEAGDYVKTEFAQHGDVGTLVLKPVPGHTPPKYKVRLSVNHLYHWCGH